MVMGRVAKRPGLARMKDRKYRFDEDERSARSFFQRRAALEPCLGLAALKPPTGGPGCDPDPDCRFSRTGLLLARPLP
ncbi:hypothetical protein DBR21_17850 [Caulobacter sp. HMWF009]|nr:hypothetical protein DBR21_17850 [Caulobacter sp. HMWF009]PTT11327.1 hypothetical protein DBR10_03850 [Caulobacter sp. HMWF025]